MLCRQCNQPVSILHRGLLSGICAPCRSHPTVETKCRASILYRRINFAVVTILAISLLITIPFFPMQFSSRDFNSGEWIAGTRETRGQMAKNLVGSQLLMDKPEAEVLSILGEPDIANFGGQTLRYNVVEGRRSILRSYRNDLVIRFGKGNEVFDVGLEPHQSK